MSVTRRSEADVGYVEIDNPPGNAIDQTVRQALLDAVRWAEQKRLTRVILSGVGQVFAVGADVLELANAPQEPQLLDVVSAIDESFVPWIAAINGDALGGGAELAMACRMRIMAPGAQIGLTDVALGGVAGAGGTQRLPRLVGLAKALEMIALGRPVGAIAAGAAQLVHLVEADPVEAAYMVNTEELVSIVPTWELPAPEIAPDIIEEARRIVALDSPNQIAPFRAIDVIKHGLHVPFHDALVVERAAFLELYASDQAEALRHVFNAERAARVSVDLGLSAVIGDRLLMRYREAADTVFMDGSTPWEVDEAMVAFGFAMGPYEAQDISGLDVAYADRRRQDATRDANRRYIPLVDRMIELGKLGRKTGAGWYRYPGGNGKVEDPIVADLALEESHFAGRTRTDYTADDIRKRLTLAMINEAAEILFEGVAPTARDIDAVSVARHGFPRWRGGLMHYADHIGADAIVRELQILAIKDPIAWKISQMLIDCAERDIRLAAYVRAEDL